jgi:hypothetical protein
MSAGFLPTIRGGLHIRTRHDAERDIVSISNSGYLWLEKSFWGLSLANARGCSL